MKYFIILAVILLSTGSIYTQCAVNFQHVELNGVVTFVANSNSTNANAYTWDFDDGTSGVGSQAVHQYNVLAPTTFNVCVTATNLISGCSAVQCKPVLVHPLSSPCTTSVSYSHTQSSAGLSLQSTTTGFSTTAQYNWHFGQSGVSSSQANPTVQLAPGIHNICLTVTDGTCSDSYCSFVTVLNTNSCNTSVHYTSTQASAGLNFQSTISGFGGSVQYNWNFGFGGGSSTLANPTIHLSPGVYNVCLTVTDGICTDTHCSLVTVLNNNPCNTSVNYTSTITTNGVNFQSAITGFGSTVQYNWQFGFGGGSSTQANPTVPLTPGIYNICLTVTDGNCSDTYCSIVNVASPCTTSVSHTNTQVVGGVNFQSVITGFGTNTQYSWQFGPGGGSSTQANPTVQLNPGIYNVCLTVTDGTCTETYCSLVTVSSPCITTVNYTKTQTSNGVNFQSAITGYGNSVQYNWQFGFGGGSSTQANPTVQLAPGIYNVCLTVSDGICTDTYCSVVTVSSPCTTSVTYTSTQTAAGVSFQSVITGFGTNAQYNWQFGSGNNGSVQANPTVQLSPGIYNVCLTVSDGNCTDTYCSFVTVAVTNPCTTSVSFTSVQTLSGVNFQSAVSGFSSTAQYYWHFGAGGVFSSLQNPTITLNPGTYYVCLTVTDGSCTDNFCTTITVATPNPCATYNVFFHYHVTYPGTGAFMGHISGSSNPANTTYTWHFGNGNTATGGFAMHLFSGPAAWTTPAGDYYQVCLTATDMISGCTDTYCTYVLVPHYIVPPWGPVIGNWINLPFKPVEDNTSFAQNERMDDTENLTSESMLEKDIEISFDVFPNPVSDEINVKIVGAYSKARLTLMNVGGKIVYHKDIINETYEQIVIPVQDLAAGMYFLNLTTDNFQETQKIVKK